MKLWHFIIGWVLFWVVLSKCVYPRYIPLSDIFLTIAIIGGGSMTIFFIMNIAIKIIGG